MVQDTGPLRATRVGLIRAVGPGSALDTFFRKAIGIEGVSLHIIAEGRIPTLFARAQPNQSLWRLLPLLDELAGIKAENIVFTVRLPSDNGPINSFLSRVHKASLLGAAKDARQCPPDDGSKSTVLKANFTARPTAITGARVRVDSSVSFVLSPDDSRLANLGDAERLAGTLRETDFRVGDVAVDVSFSNAGEEKVLVSKFVGVFANVTGWQPDFEHV